jgi:hypoxanthine phosphoribosyltransferase
VTAGLGEIYLPAAEIARRVGELGSRIAADYEGEDLVLVVPLRGSLVFAADLSRCIRIPLELDFMELEPYGRGEDGVRLLKDLDGDVRGRRLLIVEDVVDTGLTLRFLVRTLTLRGPASVDVVTLLDRPYRRLVDDLPVRYVGFTVADELYVGYGFDLDHRFRNLPDLHVFRGRNVGRAA